jgi:predicted phosphodiesterase
MRIAVMSDIHGNAVGLDAVLADLRDQRIDQTVCLGDAIQGGPQPTEVVARLRQMGCPVVMGNADKWLLTGVTTGSEPTSPEREARLTAVRQWTLSKLSEADCVFIDAFVPTVEIPLDGGHNLLCFHGSPRNFDEVFVPLTPQDEFEKGLGEFVPNILTGGHTHVQYLRRLADTFFFNPGSVGAAYSHEQSGDPFRVDSWAQYAVLTSEGDKLGVEFRRIPYHPDSIIEVYRQSGRPYAEESAAEYQR